MKIFFQKIPHEVRDIALFGLAGLVLALVLSLIRPLEYSSTVRLLVLQKNVPVDAYTAIKAIETITENLSEIVYTSSFFDRALAADTRIDRNQFSPIEQKRRKQWSRAVSTQLSRGSGFFSVTVYNRDKHEATRIVTAIANVLKDAGWEYVNSQIELKMVDTPLESRFPVRPNVAVNALMGLVLGAMVGGGYMSYTSKNS